MNKNIQEAPHGLQKTLRWYHGFLLALPISAGLFVSVGYSISAIGAIPAALVCALLAVVALLQNKLFAEMAAMFPDKTGGVATFAIEGWKCYFAAIAPVAAFGYWCGWALVLSLIGLTIGSLIQGQWFPHATWVLFRVAGVDFGLPHLISAIAMTLCTALNVAGIKVAVRFNQVIGTMFIVVLFVVAIGPFLTGQWDAANLSWNVNGGWRTIVIWFYINAWAIYGSELCAVFAPEYKETTRDTSRALTSIALFIVGVYAVIPITIAGQLGESVIASNPITYGVIAVNQLSSGLSGAVTAVLCGALFMSMISSSADAGRALYGIASEGMSIRQFDQLNRNGVPSRALWATMAVNLVVLVLVGNSVAILIASNLGYIVAITLAVIAFLLLRKDRPHWPRPIRLSRIWIPVAFVVAGFNAFILIVGASNPELSYSGSWKDIMLGIGLLLTGVVFYIYRKVVQDAGSLVWRETPPDAPASAGVAQPESQ